MTNLKLRTNLSFLVAIHMMKKDGVGHRASRDSKPGMIIWMKDNSVASNVPIEYDDYFANDWRVFEDSTEIRE